MKTFDHAAWIQSLKPGDRVRFRLAERGPVQCPAGCTIDYWSESLPGGVDLIALSGRVLEIAGHRGPSRCPYCGALRPEKDNHLSLWLPDRVFAPGGMFSSFGVYPTEIEPIDS